MIAVQVDASCGDCGGELAWVASGLASRAEGRAVLKCSVCHHHWVVLVRMDRASVDPEAAHRQRRMRAHEKAKLVAGQV